MELIDEHLWLIQLYVDKPTLHRLSLGLRPKYFRENFDFFENRSFCVFDAFLQKQKTNTQKIAQTIYENAHFHPHPYVMALYV